jgi:hypothetical protein
MQLLPQLEHSLRLAFAAGDGAHPSGVLYATYFLRAPTRGRRRSELAEAPLFSEAFRARLGARAAEAIERAMDAQSYRGCPRPRALVPVATREWLARGALALAEAEGYPLMWALLGAIAELEDCAHRLLGPRTPRAIARRVLRGVGVRALRVEPFAALSVRVLKIAQAVYVACRHAGRAHEEAFAAVQDRLWSPHPTGRRKTDGAEVRGAYLPSLVQAASGNARRRLRRNADARRTQEHARTLLARFASAGAQLWPWRDGAGRATPGATDELTPDLAALCFFALLTRASSERRRRGGPAGGLSAPLADAGFGAPEWLPDRTDDLAVRLFAAGLEDAAGNGERLEAVSLLVRATLSRESTAKDLTRALQRLSVDVADADAPALLEGGRARLPRLLAWLEENARELLEVD